MSDPQSAPIVLLGHTNYVSYAAFSPDGQKIVTTSDDRTARVWDIAGQKVAPIVLTGHGGPVDHAEFSPDGKLVFTRSLDGTVRVWEVSGPRPMARILNVGMSPFAKFGPDGRRVVAVAGDGTAQLWDVSDPRPTPAIKLEKQGVRLLRAAFSPDGKQVVKGAFGAPIPVDQIDELADYFGTVDGRAGASQPGALDSQAN